MTEEEIREIINRCRYADVRGELLALRNIPDSLRENNELSLAQLQREICSICKREITLNQLQPLLDEIRRDFQDLENMPIEDWQHEERRNSCVELYEFVRDYIRRNWHIKRPGLKLVSSIIASVLGNMPIITQSMVRALHDRGYLRCVNCTSFRRIFEAIATFIRENQEHIDMIFLAVADLLPNCSNIALITLILWHLGSIIYQNRERR